MEITYSGHAVERMRERNISTSEVELIISSPDGKIVQSRDKAIYYKKIKYREDNLIAAVTITKSVNRFEVITVMINFEVKT